jgi:hypothetical protein
MKLKLIFTFLTCYCFSVFGQENLDKIILKKIKLGLLEKVDQYALLSGISNDDERDDFYKLFENENVLIANDIMPDNKLLEKLTVKEYADKIPEFHSLAISTSIRPYLIGFENFTDLNSGTFWVDAKKYILGMSKKGIVYKDTFDIRITYKVNYNKNEFKITDITLNSKRGHYLVITSFSKGLFKKKTMSLDTILIKNKLIKLNEDGQYLIRDFEMKSPIIIEPYSEDLMGSYMLSEKNLELVLANKNNENNIDLIFRKSLFFVEPNYSFNPLSSFSPISTTYSNIVQNNIFSFSTSFIISTNLYRGKKGYWDIRTGITYANFNYNNVLNNNSETYNSIDVGNSNYVRTNQISNLVEKHKITYLSIPVNLEKGFHLKKGYGIYFNTGISFVFGINGERKTNTNANYSGYYKDLFGITIKENGIYDFGYYNLEKSSTLETVSSLFTIDTGAGMYKKISKKTLVKIGLNYQKSLRGLFENNSSSISRNKNELNSITQLNNNFNINFFSLNLGFKYSL